MEREHSCLNGERVTADVFWVYDGYGIPLALVCYKCESQKLSKYRSDIMDRYNADEDIDGD
jgi:hypothetical protein